MGHRGIPENKRRYGGVAGKTVSWQAAEVLWTIRDMTEIRVKMFVELALKKNWRTNAIIKVFAMSILDTGRYLG